MGPERGSYIQLITYDLVKRLNSGIFILIRSSEIEKCHVERGPTAAVEMISPIWSGYTSAVDLYTLAIFNFCSS